MSLTIISNIVDDGRYNNIIILYVYFWHVSLLKNKYITTKNVRKKNQVFFHSLSPAPFLRLFLSIGNRYTCFTRNTPIRHTHDSIEYIYHGPENYNLFYRRPKRSSPFRFFVTTLIIISITCNHTKNIELFCTIKTNYI